jgi:serine/threonine protein kinase
MAANLKPPLKPFGPFQLLEKLGHGGMGTVFKAQRSDGGIVAVKVANMRVANEPVLSQRFHNEYLVAGQLHHPHIVQALGHGIENGIPYLVLEYVPGCSLSHQIKESGPLSLPTALAIFSQLTEAVRFIHQNKIVHRDIKPANILITPEGQAKLADLGLIKDLEAATLLTQSRVGLGTIEYAAPEQFDDARNVGSSCDLYALAATLYVALTGKNAFGSGSLARVLARKLDYQFTPLATLVPEVSQALEQIVHRAMHPEPAQRPTSAAEFLAGLRDTAPEPAVGSRPVVVAPKPSVSDERRTDARYPMQIPTTCGPLSAPGRNAWNAQILDLSAGGVCLELPRRFEANTILQICLPGEEPCHEATYPVRVCWCKGMPDRKWMVGCAFVRSLEEKDLDRMLLLDLTETRVVQR